jgi:hypothetical protein
MKNMRNTPMQDAEIWAAWKAQAHSGIAQGQTLAQFVAHAARLNRELARRAFLAALAESQPLYPDLCVEKVKAARASGEREGRLM